MDSSTAIYLQMFADGKFVTYWELTGSVISVGRSVESLVAADQHIQLGDSRLQRHECLLLRAEEGWEVRITGGRRRLSVVGRLQRADATVPDPPSGSAGSPVIPMASSDRVRQVVFFLTNDPQIDD